MEDIFKSKKILITGAGSIGSELLKRLIQFDVHSIRMLDNCELKLHNLKQTYKKDRRVKCLLGDIRDRERLKTVVKEVDYVFHTAALKHVSFCEDNPVEATKTNLIGTQNLIDVCIEENVDKLINISTDKCVNPINVMGATKLLGERLIASAIHYKGNCKTIFVTVRFGNVIGSSGSLIPIFENQIKNNQPLTVTDKCATRFMMRTEDAINLILDTVSICRGSEIFVLKMPIMKIINIAKQMNRKYGRDENNIVFTGLDKGEKMHEELITKEEMRLAMQNEKMIVIPPNVSIPYYESIGFKRLI